MTQGNSMNYRILKAIVPWFHPSTSEILHQVSHIRKSCYFSYGNLRNYLFMNEFWFNKKVILKMIK